MPRPAIPRTVQVRPAAILFKPGGIPGASHVVLELAELEALRLTDLERLPQSRAAERMGVSRQTFGRILAAARRKTTEALVLGKALRIGGGAAALAGGGPRCPWCSRRSASGASSCGTCGNELVHLRRQRP